MHALDDELLSFRNMECYRQYLQNPLAIPKGRLINSKIVIDIKFNPDGTIKKFKSQLVARGDQLNSLDPNNIAVIAKSETLRILLAFVLY